MNICKNCQSEKIAGIPCGVCGTKDDEPAKPDQPLKRPSDDERLDQAAYHLRCLQEIEGEMASLN